MECSLILKETKYLQGYKKESDSENRSQNQLGCLVQGRVEPPDALDRQDLGVASILPRTDGQGADLAGCRTTEMTALFLLR